MRFEFDALTRNTWPATVFCETEDMLMEEKKTRKAVKMFFSNLSQKLRRRFRGK